MSLFSAAERFAAVDRSAVTLDTARCLHTRDRFSACEACFELCPAGAIQPGKPPTLDIERCQTCLACLPACPVGAYQADDALPSLINCATRVESKFLELLCEFHPSAETGTSTDVTGIRVRGCLAGLGVGAYLVLLAIGKKRIVVRTDMCKTCRWSTLVSRIHSQVAAAKRLLSTWEMDEALELITDLPMGQERPLWDAENPPLSRRDLFRLASKQAQVAIARAVNVDHRSSERHPGRDYIRITTAIAHLPEVPSSTLSLEEMGFAILSVTEDCTACNACARACPTTALDYEENTERSYYRLKFKPWLCIGCEACVHVCAPKAIRVDHAPSFVQIFGNREAAILNEGGLVRCEKCNVPFASRLEKRLCPPCEYRRENPFGSRFPYGVKIQIESINPKVQDDR